MRALRRLGIAIVGLVVMALALVIGTLTDTAWLSLAAVPLFFLSIGLGGVWASHASDAATGLDDLDLDL